MTEINIRKAGASDLQFFFHLRNEPSVRKASFNTEPIDLAAHQSWFLRKIKDPNSDIFVIESAQRERVGQVRIDKRGDNGEVNVAICPRHRGKGYAPEAVKRVCAIFFSSHPKVNLILAHIKRGNASSAKTFRKAGFANRGATRFQGHICMEMALEKGNKNG